MGEEATGAGVDPPTGDTPRLPPHRSSHSSRRTVPVTVATTSSTPRTANKRTHSSRRRHTVSSRNLNRQRTASRPQPTANRRKFRSNSQREATLHSSTSTSSNGTSTTRTSNNGTSTTSSKATLQEEAMHPRLSSWHANRGGREKERPHPLKGRSSVLAPPPSPQRSTLFFFLWGQLFRRFSGFRPFLSGRVGDWLRLPRSVLEPSAPCEMPRLLAPEDCTFLGKGSAQRPEFWALSL